MSENNQIMSMEGQLCGIPLAGPESFSQQQLDYLKRALGVDETVLWEASSPIDVKVTSIQLSESPMNFERIKIYFGSGDTIGTGNSLLGAAEFYPALTQIAESITLSAVLAGKSGTEGEYFLAFDEWSNIHTTTWTHLYGAVQNIRAHDYLGGNDKWCNPYKIVGIHRIAGGNT